MPYTHGCQIDLDEDRCVILEVPGDAEDAERDLSRLVHKLTCHFEETDYAQLLRAQEVREAQYKWLYHEMVGTHPDPIQQDELS